MPMVESCNLANIETFRESHDAGVDTSRAKVGAALDTFGDPFPTAIESASIVRSPTAMDP